MTPRDCILRTLSVLNELRIPHMLTGSLASNAYGKPRASKDADFVVALPTPAVADIGARMLPLMVLDPQMSFETVTMAPRYRLRAARGGFEIELFQLRDDPFDQARFARRRQIKYEDSSTWLPTAEDVVIQKLRWAARAKRAKDIDDAKNVIAVQATTLDWPYIRRWCDVHESRSLLEDLRAAARVEA